MAKEFNPVKAKADELLASKSEAKATTMSVTPIMWPILKKAGYSPNMAAGLIATGGIGAVLSPPLMGAAAFLIMQFMGVSFWDVIVMVTVPRSSITWGRCSWWSWRPASITSRPRRPKRRPSGR